MRKFLRDVLLLVLPLVAANELLRLRRGNLRWYEAAIEEARARPPKALASVIFVGSSRVASAIDPEAFGARCGELSGAPVHAINAGMGHSMAAMHYLGLRAMADALPNGLRGVRVLIEAPGGFAPIGPGWSDTWGETWANSAGDDLLVPYLRPGDMGGLLGSGMPRDEKLKIAILTGCRLCRTFWAARAWALGHGELWVDAWLAPPKGAAGHDGLTTAGGVRSDEAGMTAARRLAISLVEADMKAQTPVADWETSAMAEVIRLVQARGGTAQFFTMPLSPVQTPPLDTPIRRGDRASFSAAASRWQTPVTDVRFETTGEDFPDHWHLRSSKAAPFSVAVADAVCAPK